MTRPVGQYRRDALTVSPSPDGVTRLNGVPLPTDEITMDHVDVRGVECPNDPTSATFGTGYVSIKDPTAALRQFNRDLNAKADAQDKQEAAQSAAMDALLEVLVLLAMLAVVGAACWFFGARALNRMQAEIAGPVVEMPLPESGRDFDAPWRGIPTPPFNQGGKP